MNLVTTFNYDHKNTFALGLQKCWLYQAAAYAKKFEIHLIHGENGISPEILNFASELGLSLNLHLGESVPHNWEWNKLYGSIHIWNMYNVHQVLRRANEPIIYFDADALLFHGLEDFWARVKEKPFIGTPHYLRGNYFNGGVYSISDSEFIDFDKIAKCFDESRKDDRWKEIRKKCERASFALTHSAFCHHGGTRGGGEQAMYINYFVCNNYNPYLDGEINSWNCHGRVVSLKKSLGKYTAFVSKERQEKLKSRWLSKASKGNDNGLWSFDGKVRGVHYWKGCRGKLQGSDLYDVVVNKK